LTVLGDWTGLFGTRFTGISVLHLVSKIKVPKASQIDLSWRGSCGELFKNCNFENTTTVAKRNGRIEKWQTSSQEIRSGINGQHGDQSHFCVTRSTTLESSLVRLYNRNIPMSWHKCLPQNADRKSRKPSNQRD
jgi:hypothetical protein